ncbi:hypothetical protein Y695_03099 [Hydrogenophaga sp. T4]|nr:hypothetical protein Y695_03099 [Hydrogenophaga sp. T4]
MGDDERDIVAGREAGMFTVAARYGYLALAVKRGIGVPMRKFFLHCRS